MVKSEWYQSDAKLFLDSELGETEPLVSGLRIPNVLFLCGIVALTTQTDKFVVYPNHVQQSQSHSVSTWLYFCLKSP